MAIACKDICIFNVKIKKMYSVTVNNEKITVEKEGKDFLVDGNAVDWDVRKIDDHTYHVLKNQRSYTIEVIRVELLRKTLVLKLDNKVYEIIIKDKFDLLLEKLGMNAASAQAVVDIKAPMPGLILEIMVKAGDVLKKGDPLLVLEAMKMENVLKSSGDGEIKEVLVEVGSSVEKNQTMIIFK